MHLWSSMYVAKVTTKLHKSPIKERSNFTNTLLSHKHISILHLLLSLHLWSTKRVYVHISVLSLGFLRKKTNISHTSKKFELMTTTAVDLQSRCFINNMIAVLNNLLHALWKKCKKIKPDLHKMPLKLLLLKSRTIFKR